MKVAFAFCAAWLLRFVYLFALADRIEEWAGINYDPEQDDETTPTFSEVVQDHASDALRAVMHAPAKLDGKVKAE